MSKVSSIVRSSPSSLPNPDIVYGHVFWGPPKLLMMIISAIVGRSPQASFPRDCGKREAFSSRRPDLLAICGLRVRSPLVVHSEGNSGNPSSVEWSCAVALLCSGRVKGLYS